MKIRCGCGCGCLWGEKSTYLIGTGLKISGFRKGLSILSSECYQARDSPRPRNALVSNQVLAALNL
eukprot:scaffold460_cov81-Skeletonema_menzelii.AAC.5